MKAGGEFGGSRTRQEPGSESVVASGRQRHFHQEIEATFDAIFIGLGLGRCAVEYPGEVFRGIEALVLSSNHTQPCTRSPWATASPSSAAGIPPSMPSLSQALGAKKPRSFIAGPDRYAAYEFEQVDGESGPCGVPLPRRALESLERHGHVTAELASGQYKRQTRNPARHGIRRALRHVLTPSRAEQVSMLKTLFRCSVDRRGVVNHHPTPRDKFLTYSPGAIAPTAAAKSSTPLPKQKGTRGIHAFWRPTGIGPDTTVATRGKGAPRVRFDRPIRVTELEK